MPQCTTIIDDAGLRARVWWDGEALVSRCRSCDGAGSFSMGYCGEPHLREPCYDCDSVGFRKHSWPAIRRARRARRRALLRRFVRHPRTP